MKLEEALELVLAEYHRAKAKYPDHPTVEHSMFVLEEEVDELKAELRIKDENRSSENITAEAKQVGAMALRFLVDCCDSPKREDK